MSQPSVVQFFQTRKRSAIDDKLHQAKKVLVLDSNSCSKTIEKDDQHNLASKQTNKTRAVVFRRNVPLSASISTTNPKNINKIKESKHPKKDNEAGQDIKKLIGKMVEKERPVTPESSKPQDLTIIKKRLIKSSRLTELKESIARFKEGDKKLQQAENATSALLSRSPKLKNFNSIQFEVAISPQKINSPEKPYLSPRKESNVCRKLLSSPLKTVPHLSSDILSQSSEQVQSRPGLKLPYKYRTLAEIFRAIDTISQLLFNRKELITFKKLKSAVEEMLKRNLYEKHLAQIKYLYPEAFNYSQKKLKKFTVSTTKEEWELVLTPNIGEYESITPEILLQRRRTFFNLLIDKVKIYHEEFLQSLTPPMIIPREKITAWHPEFDVEKVPDIEHASVPQPPIEERFKTGKEVLEKAREMFKCNTRLEQAIAKLKESREKDPTTVESKTENAEPTSILKGIPEALLQKVREKQAAKALASMTKSIDKDKEVQMYLKLPELARLTWNLFVTEKKSVMALDVVVEKLGNSYSCTLNRLEMENHLRTIAKEVPHWLIFHNIRNSLFLKLAKNTDLKLVLNKLEKSAKEKL